MAKMKRAVAHHVYIVECADGTLYTGCTPKLKRRVALHNSGRGAKYTSGRRPVKLVWSEKRRGLSEALKREAAIKQFSREMKERLIASGA